MRMMAGEMGKEIVAIAELRWRANGGRRGCVRKKKGGEKKSRVGPRSSEGWVASGWG